MAKNGGVMANGMAAPLRAGGAVEDMAAGIDELQHRMGATLASGGGGGGGATLDPEGDACVASLQSMLSAMQGMSVGANPSAQPALPLALARALEVVDVVARAHGEGEDVRALGHVVEAQGARRAAERDLGSTRVIQRRFNVSVPRARVTENTSTLRDRSER